MSDDNGHEKPGLFGRLGELAADAVKGAERAADAVEDRIEAGIKELRHDHHDHDHDHDHDRTTVTATAGTAGTAGTAAHGGHGGDGRPGKTVGTSRGEIDGSAVTPADLHGTHPSDSWPGARKDMPVPMLFLRANPGDNGSRPVVGCFWESPDIHILAGISPTDAPDVPSVLGQTALAGVPNTVYAHVWNFGRGAAHDITVEFWWLDPSLGVTEAGLHPIGQTPLSLGARGSGSAHAVVKCPEAWIPTAPQRRPRMPDRASVNDVR